MFPRLQPCKRQSVLSTLLLFFLLALFVDLTSATPSPVQGQAPDKQSRDASVLEDLSYLAIAADTSCEGSEGQYNCLSDSFQYCLNGTWSDVTLCTENSEQTAETSSLCSPIGRTDTINFNGECEISAAWGWGNGGGGWGGGRGYYGAGERVEVSRWVWSFVGMIFVFALNAETAGTANTYENPNINTATSHTTTAGEVPAAHATSRAATSTVGGGDAPTTRSGGIGQQIKGAFAQGHGMGEVIRGKFNSAVDTAAGDSQGMAKNKNVTTGGEREFATKDFVKKGTLDKAL
ncbi:hypothetical protein CFIO01_12897 [Colletotrichum fioriniae PJ7]|uniref:Uncharacterized protein n=1 Tax=Colletotrichum fioriniae PJ7 TaxID=1445577 RepID=A0A010RWG5_9PEZI|nr:hypothetical protein CFIO01_12897 [Colletotrichum fioriniae PJ7]